MAFPITIKTFYNLEPELFKEVQALNAGNIKQGNRIVTLEGDWETVYRANYELRTALKVLLPIKSARLRDQQDLYKVTSSVDWSALFSYRDDFAVEATVNSKLFNHSGFVALKVKDAIADQFRQRYGKRPSVNKQNPRVQVHVHIREKGITLSLDSSGAPLFKRGYKNILGEAPLNEVLAAGMLLKTQWNGETPIYDLMCGTGTLLTEAALIAHNLPANYYRKHFAFRNWHNFDAKTWHRITENARKAKKDPAVKFYANDINSRAITGLRKNIARFAFKDKFIVSNTDFVNIAPDSASGLVIVNPPYGHRLKQEDLYNFYKQLGSHLKQHFPGFDAWILSNNKEAIKHIGLRAKRRETLYNGGMEAKFLKFPLKSGNFG